MTIALSTITVGDRADVPAVTEIPEDALAVAAKWDPRVAQLEAARMLRAEIEIEVRKGKLEPGEELTPDDIQTIRDTFEGASDLDLDALIRELMADSIIQQSKVPGIKAMIEGLQARQKRAEAKVEWNKSLIERAMVVAGRTGKDNAYDCDIGRVSVRPKTATVEVIEESYIPTQFFKRADPVINKIELNKAVLARHKAMLAALAIKDNGERAEAVAKVQEDFGDEIAGVQVVSDGYTTTIKFT